MGAAWERQEQAQGERLTGPCLPKRQQTAGQGSAFIGPPYPEAIHLPLCSTGLSKIANIYSGVF